MGRRACGVLTPKHSPTDGVFESEPELRSETNQHCEQGVHGAECACWLVTTRRQQGRCRWRRASQCGYSQSAQRTVNELTSDVVGRSARHGTVYRPSLRPARFVTHTRGGNVPMHKEVQRAVLKGSQSLRPECAGMEIPANKSRHAGPFVCKCDDG